MNLSNKGKVEFYMRRDRGYRRDIVATQHQTRQGLTILNNIKEYFLKHPYIAFIIKYSVISIIAIVAVTLLGDPIDNLNRLFIPVFLFIVGLIDIWRNKEKKNSQNIQNIIIVVFFRQMRWKMSFERKKKITNIFLLLLLFFYVVYAITIGFNLQFEYFFRFLFIILMVYRGILFFKN